MSCRGEGGVHDRATLGSRFDPAVNSFDAVRLGLAIVVVFCHCYTLKGSPSDPISDLLNYGYGGLFAVDCFLVISGFLVTRSFEQRDLTDYLLSRIVRVVPGLALVTIVEVFIIGPFFSKDSAWVFLTYVGFRHLENIAVFGIDVQMYGAFPTTTPPWMINGSLWTIPIECSFYLLLPALLFLRSTTVLVCALFASLISMPIMAYFGITAQDQGPSLLTSVHYYMFANLLAYFLAGAIAWRARDHLSYSAGPVLLCLIALFAAAHTPSADFVLKLALPYLVIFVSISGTVGTRLKRRIGDLSYGTYLFGFPVILSVMALMPDLSILVTFAVVTIITLAIAYLSWHVVERPSLRLKPRRSASG